MTWQQKEREKWNKNIEKLNDIGLAMFGDSICDYWIKVMQAREEEIREKISKELCDKFDKLESADADKSGEQWRNYKFIRNNIRDILLTKEQ